MGGLETTPESCTPSGAQQSAFPAGSWVTGSCDKKQRENRNLGPDSANSLSREFSAVLSVGRIGDRHELCIEDGEMHQHNPSTEEFWSRVT